MNTHDDLLRFPLRLLLDDSDLSGNVAYENTSSLPILLRRWTYRITGTPDGLAWIAIQEIVIYQVAMPAGTIPAVSDSVELRTMLYPGETLVVATDDTVDCSYALDGEWIANFAGFAE